jgi:hypothetical protein
MMRRGLVLLAIVPALLSAHGAPQGQRTKNVKMGDLASSADLAFH